MFFTYLETLTNHLDVSFVLDTVQWEKFSTNIVGPHGKTPQLIHNPLSDQKDRKETSIDR